MKIDMNVAQIEKNIFKINKSIDKKTFIYDLFLAYGLPKASITRLKKGSLNLSKKPGEISWKKKAFFKEVYDEDLHVVISDLADEIISNERFIIVTDYETLLAIDTKTNDRLDININDLHKHYDFFLPWAGMEKAQHQNENPADIKAAEKMAKFFDEIKRNNADDSPKFIHNLNVFLSRLLFCLFAEDTNIFNDGQFTNAISSHTQSNGTDLNTYLDKLFEVLNTPQSERKKIPEYLNAFPYVNGGLFKQKLSAPKFNRHSRKAIIDAGELDWSAINPDIFGSMMQAVITPEHRGGLGIHYTSVPNIMKVIEPLFLNELLEEFEKCKYEPKKLNKLQQRLGKIKIFDPACGSGNFLIISYKELRRLEVKIIKQLQHLQKLASDFDEEQQDLIPKNQLSLASHLQIELFSRIQLSQFYGIEIDDFAHEITKLSLWLAEHQLNVEFLNEFGCTKPTLPLRDAGKIINDNACRIDWETVCPKEKSNEIYILGNPPYLGYNFQNNKQKEDIAIVFNGHKDYKKLDYIACWFYIAKKYIANSPYRFSFVSTNSICHGEQVPILWPKIFDDNDNIEISFAYEPFKWQNSARSNAGVTVVIIGLKEKSTDNKFIFNSQSKRKVENINQYLTAGQNLIVFKRIKPLSSLPVMMKGSQPTDGGYLLLSKEEKYEILESEPNLSKYIRKFVGTKEFLDDIERYCFWIDRDKIDDLLQVPELIERFEKIRELRLNSTKKATKDLAEIPWQFGEKRYYNKKAIIVPTISSERRPYFPASFVSEDTVISNTAQAIYYDEPYIFGLISSKLMIVWVEAVGGKFESRYIFSSQLCYNTFPFPLIAENHKKEITQCVYRIFEEREKYPEMTLAKLYEPNKMPEGLWEAHRLNDVAVERCYQNKPFESDEKRREYLFNLYEKMTSKEKEKNTLFV